MFWSDLDGLEREGYGFVSVAGKEAPNPPMAGSPWNKRDYWIQYDRNSLWGSVAAAFLPGSHREQRCLLEEFRPSWAVALHETVDEPQDAHFIGEGLLLIEEFPLSLTEQRAALGLGLFSPVAKWAAGCLKAPPYWAARRSLRRNSAYALLGRTARAYARGGGRLLNNIYLDFLRGYTPLGRGRVMSARGLMDNVWLTFTGYNLARYGAPGVTLETFPTAHIGLRGIEVRAARQVSYVSALLDELNSSPV